MTPRAIPNSLPRERVVLSALIHRWPAAAVHIPAGFGPGDMYQPHHAALVDAHLTLVQADRRVDALAVIEQVERAGDAGKFSAHGGVAAYVAGLADDCASLEEVPDAVQVLCGLSLLRRVAEAATAARDAALALGADPDAVGPMALTAITEATERRDGSKVIGTREGINDFLRGYEQTAQGGGGACVGSGLEALDRATGCFRPGELVTVAGLSGDGKSVLLTQIVLDSEVPALIFSLEMSGRDVWGRLVVQASGVSAAEVRSGRLDGGALLRVTRAVDTLTRAPRISVARGCGWTVEAIKSEALRWRAQTGRPERALIVVDYLQLVEASPTKARRQQSREEEVAHVIRVLKGLAQAAGCTVLTASQLNDDGKVRESRRIEQDSDYLIQIEPVEDADDEDLRDLRLVKARSAKKNTRVRVRLDGDRLRFKQHGNGEAPTKTRERRAVRRAA